MRRKFGLIPWEESFFDLFEQQTGVVRERLPILAAMRDMYTIEPQWANAIETIEQHCDALTAQIIKKAEQTFITPIDREDILALAMAIDDVLDFIEEFTIKLVDYQLLPDDALRKFFDLVATGVTCVSEGVVCLRAFKPITELRARMKEWEHGADALVRTIVKEGHELVIREIVKDAELRAMTADDLQCIFNASNEKRKRREIAELSEAAVDACERVFHVLRNVYLKEL